VARRGPAVRGRAGLGCNLLQDLGLGSHQVTLDLGVVDDVDLLGAELGHGGGCSLGLVRATDEHGGRGAQTLGDRQQLVGRLADGTVEVVNQN
jgi:hypothetical protein